ncbi:hypothetical protein NQZ68_022373 [Dissostichus eleginoides]|nr:hypothetical protein NQZ68_022373 [Dissostichus eleginoides]
MKQIDVFSGFRPWICLQQVERFVSCSERQLFLIAHSPRSQPSGTRTNSAGKLRYQEAWGDKTADRSSCPPDEDTRSQ